MTVLAVHSWPTNGHLIADVAKLGYLKADDVICDLTYGRGVWWKMWQPDVLHTLPSGADFTATGFVSESFDIVTFDPPYKLNGTPDPKVDARYGVDQATTMDDRHMLMCRGLREAARLVRPGGYVLAKCQDQVCSGKMRWQTIMLTTLADNLGLELVDRFDMTGQHRPQPMEGRTQRHPHGRPSTLLVFRKPPRSPDA